MGSSNNKEKYSLPFNERLNEQIQSKLNIQDQSFETKKLTHFIKKKLNKDFVPSNFEEKFNENGSGVEHVANLINLIYTKNTNTSLKFKCNRTIYESVFNYDIIENNSKGYSKFTQNMMDVMRLVVDGKDGNENSHDKDISLPEESLMDSKRSGENSIFRKSDQDENHNLYNKSGSDDNYENQENMKSDLESKGHSNNFLSNVPVTSASPIQDSKQNTLKLKGIKSNDSELVKSGDVSLKTISNYQKKKHRKVPKKDPVVNIKINLKDIMREDVLESSILPPKERFPKSRKENEYCPNPRMLDEINNLTAIKADVSQTNINDGSFLELVDAFVQPNKKAKERIHCRTPRIKGPQYQTQKKSMGSNATFYKTKVVKKN